MQRRYNRPHFILSSAALLILTTLMVGVDAQAQIAFTSDRNGNWEIYVISTNGKNPQNLTNNPLAHDREPSWYRPTFAVAPAGKQFTMWGWLKQVVR